MRKRIFEIIEIAAEHDRASHAYDIGMMLTILVSLVPLCTKSDAEWTLIIEHATLVIFILDYVLRELTADYKYPDSKMPFLRYPVSFMAIIDLLAILPSFGVLVSGLRILKIFRLFRTFRVLKALEALKAFRALKMFRYSRSINIISEVIKSQRESLITVAALAAGYVLLAALIVFNVEPDTFNTFFDAIYWACVSLTTVGYGDIYPLSTAGRVVTILSSAVGIAIVALPSGIITAGYMNALREREEDDDDAGPEFLFGQGNAYMNALNAEMHRKDDM